MCVECMTNAFGLSEPDELPSILEYGVHVECACEFCRNGDPCHKETDRIKEAQPDEWEAFDKACDKELDDHQEAFEARPAPNRCPLCRRHLLDNPNITWRGLGEIQN